MSGKINSNIHIVISSGKYFSSRPISSFCIFSTQYSDTKLFNKVEYLGL